MDSSTEPSPPDTVPVHRGRTLLRASGVVALLLVGGAVTWAAARDDSDYGVLFGGLLVGVGLLAAVTTGIDLRQPGRTVTTGAAPDGRPATIVPRLAVLPVMSAMGLLLMSAFCLGTAGLAVRDGLWLLVVLLGVPGLGLFGYLVAVLAGRTPSGGLYLTPSGVVDCRLGIVTAVAWDDIEVVVTRRRSVILLGLRAGGSVARGGTAPPGWNKRPPAPDGSVAVDVRTLRADPVVTDFLMQVYLGRPDLRGQLGTPASLEWAILRADPRT